MEGVKGWWEGGWVAGRACGCGGVWQRAARRGNDWRVAASLAQPWPGRKANLGAHEPRCQGRGAPYWHHATCLPSAHLPHTPATDRHYDRETSIHNLPKGRKLRIRDCGRFLRTSGSNHERICSFFPSISFKNNRNCVMLALAHQDFLRLTFYLILVDVIYTCTRAIFSTSGEHKQVMQERQNSAVNKQQENGRWKKEC